MLSIILNTFLLINYERCPQNQIQIYKSKEIFYQKDDAQKKLIEAEKSIKNSNFSIISSRVDESEEGYYHFEIDFKPAKNCKNFEIIDYEIDYSNTSQEYVFKNLKTKAIDILSIQNDAYEKKVVISYILNFINYGCIKEITIRNYKIPVYDIYSLEKLKTSIKNSFINLKLPYLIIDYDEKIIDIEYPSCKYEKSIPSFEIKRYLGLLYQTKQEAYKNAVVAKNTFEKNNTDVLYFDVYEDNGYYSFFIDWILKPIKKIEIRTYNSKKIYHTREEAIKELSNSIKNIQSSKISILEKSINDENSGYSFIIRYIEKTF